MESRSTRPQVIRALREALGLSRRALAEKAGVSEASVNRAEAEGGATLQANTLARIATGLGVGLDDISDPCESDPRYSIGGCQEDFLARNRTPSRCQLVRTLALDLANGYEQIVTGLNLSTAERIEFHVLLLGDPAGLPADAPAEVREMWAPAATANLERLRRLLAELPAPPRAVRVAAHRYHETPTVHGIAIGTDGAERYYLSECRSVSGPAGAAYFFGERDYLIADPPGGTADARRRIAAFEAAFARLWPDEPTLLYAGGPAGGVTSPSAAAAP